MHQCRGRTRYQQLLDASISSYEDFTTLKILGRGIDFATESAVEWDGDSIKRKYSHCRLKDEPALKERRVELSDGSFVKLDVELQECVEAIFKPVRVATLTRSVPDMLLHTINSLDRDEIRNCVVEGVYVYGGTSMIKNFEQRLLYKLNKTQSTQPIKKVVSFSASATTCAWSGGSNLAQLPVLKENLFTRELYDEIGAFGIKNHIFGARVPTQGETIKPSLQFSVDKPANATALLTKEIALKVSFSSS
jgi:actin-related protein